LKEVKRLEKEEKKRKKELAEKAAKLAKELEKRKKEAEEIAAKSIEEGAIMEPEILAGQELMTQAEQQVKGEGRDDTATETKPMEVANE